MSWLDFAHPFALRLLFAHGDWDTVHNYPQLLRRSGTTAYPYRARLIGGSMAHIVRYYPAIGMLPTEILQEIFLFAVADDDNQKRTKWALSHICRHWRAVAVSYPRLWARMKFEPTTQSGARRLAQMALHRAAGAELDITMVWSATAGNWAGRREKGHFISLALSRRDQWHTLAITDNEFGVESNLSVLAEGVRHALLPRLKAVRYHTTRNSREGHHVFALIASAPNLEVLNLRNVDFMGRMIPEPLRVLRLDNCTMRAVDVVYDMLALTPNLEVLHMSDSLPYAHVHEHDQRHLIALPKLRILSLGVRAYTHDAWFVSQLAAPNVHCLHLWTGRNACPRCPQLSAAVSRREQLYLSVYHAIADQGWIIDTVDVAELSCPYLPLLESMPTLRNLAVGRTSDLRAILGAVIVQNSSRMQVDDEPIPPPPFQLRQLAIHELIPPPPFQLQQLAVHDLDEPSFLLQVLRADRPTPFSTLEQIFAPRAVSLPRNLSVISPNVGVRKEAEAHEELQKKYPVTETWPDWAAPLFNEGGPARRRSL
ncbi:hypothetical protein CALCODRAFT_478929 [Calocera cornea HHB12733]|uniref:F-box domain-containing protein n=1 Tax=Calocera cornea HHB12733 TaxID=1353952 RepID=A0A165K3I1_9BASI|nr:hypothetical protein CALCODRAFT_478929 [Calocera cornea HHB12733]